MAEGVARALLRQHPLQRLPSPSRGASFVLHSIGLASFTYSFLYLVREANPINDSYGWHMQYLTIIGLSLSTLTFAVAWLADVTLSRHLFRIKNVLSVASAPMECLITVLYWGLRAIDPKLVLPDWAPPLPLSTDLSFHAMPAISLIIDLLFFSPPYAIASLPALGLSGIIAFGYWLWIEQCYSYNRFYPYPIFEMLDTTQRIGLFTFSALLMTVSTSVLIWLYSMVNGIEFDGVANGDVKKSEEWECEGRVSCDLRQEDRRRKTRGKRNRQEVKIREAQTLDTACDRCRAVIKLQPVSFVCASKCDWSCV